ncbi:chemotaxis protein CheC [Halapricum desulfuricans]|uniref:Chemotaxis protein CheC, inhibitor of MCP methylation n=1 Tax=Halapricum desulfuricans TaxID=2841257 RepID=A0A897N985_9EURY|nr:chemotaxis protein CheC [Halapricum desulfuricans]QSG06946.1 Chemotaxis protein CheC, inhibitor of MCP methylation [Halapricum desulfuricans]
MPLLIDIRKLRIINTLMKRGTENVTRSLSSLADVDADVEITSLSFVEPSDIAAEIGTDEIYSASIDLREPPYGVFLLTFPPATAAEMATLMTGSPVEGEFNRLQKSALQEMCNILTSGFIDGMANTLGTTIDMETPKLEYSNGATVAEETLSHVRRDALSIVLDSMIDVAEEDAAFKIRIFLVPDPGSFVNLLDHLSVDEISDRTESAGSL